MFDIQLGVSGVICAIGMGLFISMGIALVLALIDDSSCYVNNKGCIIAAIIGLIVFVISLFFVIKYYRLSVAPQFVHKELLNDLDEAEKELQKFYIDHPEFKEVQDERK